MKLTQATINNLTLPPDKADAIYFDDDVPGLGLRLRAGGMIGPNNSGRMAASIMTAQPS
jgi:hypothetical protein